MVIKKVLNILNGNFRESNIKINLKLPNTPFNRGGLVKGTIEIEGTEKEYMLRGVFVDLLVEKEGLSEKFGDYKVHSEFVLLSEEKKKINFEIILPEDGPFTKQGEEIILITRLDIKGANDPMDKDYIVVTK